MKDKSHISSIAFSLVAVMSVISIAADGDSSSKQLPLLNTKKYPILAGTHKGAGFFSLCEGHNGKIYVGTELSGQNAFLVEFDPATDQQRIVIDVNDDHFGPFRCKEFYCFETDPACAAGNQGHFIGKFFHH